MRTDRIKVLLIISIALTTLSGVLTYFAVIESRKRVDLVFHSYEVLRQSTSLLSAISRAESNVRGYMLTWDSTFLLSYAKQKQEHKTQLESLRKISIPDEHQLDLVDTKINPYVTYKIEQLGIVATIAKAHGIDSAVQYSYANKEKLTILNLEKYTADFNQYEYELLNARLADLNETLAQQNIIRYISFGLIGITLLAAFATIVEKQRKNNELITQLNLTNAQLELRVKERTQELDRKNNSITELNSQLQQSMEEIQSFYETLNLRNKKAEDALAEISDLYNNAPCGYHSLNSNGVFVRINDTELKWLGYTREEVIGKLSFSQVLTEESQALFKRLYPEFIKNGSIANIEYQLKRKDGSTFPVILSSTAAYSASGTYESGRTTMFDISARKDLENQLLKANDALIHLNEEKDHFLGIAAHDLKSPLNSILGLLNLLKSEAGLSSEQQEYVQFIEQSCISMKRLVNNLLDINKIEQGGFTLTKEKILIADILQEHHQAFKETASQKEITLRMEDFSNGTYLHTDHDVLTRILENLLSNALKFSPGQKEVVLRVSVSKALVRFEVSDQGPGIRPEELPRLFGKFQRLSTRPTSGESSSGLGLSIVKELVTLMKGTITVETEVGKGTTFITELPLHS